MKVGIKDDQPTSSTLVAYAAMSSTSQALLLSPTRFVKRSRLGPEYFPHLSIHHFFRTSASTTNLIYYNVNPTVINWIKSFLCFRKQRVKLNRFFSEWNDAIRRIPQGTILGPILFIMYINDLPDVCKHVANVYLFADDAKLYKNVLCDDDHKSLHCVLNVLQEWSDKWLLK